MSQHLRTVAGHSNPEDMGGFSFLSPRYIIVEKYPQSVGSVSMSLDVSDLRAARPEGSTDPRLVRKFQLPLLVKGASVNYVTTRSDPSSACPTSNARPFCTAPNSGLLTVSMSFTIRNKNIRCIQNCTLFVHHYASRRSRALLNAG